jgi:hypothetical protein
VKKKIEKKTLNLDPSRAAIRILSKSAFAIIFFTGPTPSVVLDILSKIVKN